LRNTQKHARQEPSSIQYTTKSLQSSGIVQSVTTGGSHGGSAAGNYQSYSVSGSMKREPSNESGSLMRSLDKKPYGHEYSEQPRPRVQADLNLD